MFILTAHLLVTLAKLARPGGLRAVAAESLAVKHQLLIMKRSRQRAPNLTSTDRLTLGVCALFVSRERLSKIAVQLSSAFDIEINKDAVRRILIRCYRPVPGGDGPSWLSVIGHAKDSLWSVDFFRCESILLKSYWIMIVMDVFTRRIIGFGVAPADLDGPVICRMFNRAIAKQTPPKYLSSDNDPLFRFHRWRANLRILEID